MSSGTVNPEVSRLQGAVVHMHHLIAEQQARLTAIESLVGLFGLEEDLTQLLWECLDVAMQAARVESSSVLLYDPQADVLRFAAARGPKGNEVLNFTVKPTEGLAGWCFTQNTAVSVSNVEQDERFSRAISDAIGYQVKTILAAPLQARGRPVGVLELINKQGGNELTFADSELASAMARVIGLLLNHSWRPPEQSSEPVRDVPLMQVEGHLSEESGAGPTKPKRKARTPRRSTRGETA